MNTPSWIVKGVRVNKYRNRDHRWGKGKVHWLVYFPKSNPENWNGFGYYVSACRMEDETAHILGGVNADIGNVTKDEPVTCLLCLKIRGA